MTMQLITASILSAVQQAVAIKRENTDSLSESSMNWQDEARAILSAIPNNEHIKLDQYLKTTKGYDDETLGMVGAIVSAMVSPALIEALATGADLNAWTGEDKPDADIVNHIISGLKLPTALPTKGEPVTTESPTKTSALINPALKDTLNTILSQATGGKLKDLGAVLDARDTSEAELATVKADLLAERIKARTPVIPTTGRVAIAAGELTYELVQAPANTIFTHANGKPTGKGLAFLIPTLVWKDSAGTIVQHPETPDIDPNYDFDGIKLLQFLTGVTRGMNQWLFGHTGTGKTTFVEQVAARTGFPCIRINLDANLERADIVGHVALHEEKGTTVTKFEEGILPYAMQRPGFLIMDEIDAGRPDILFSVQKALESKGLTLTEDNHRIIAPHPLFRFAATANTRGQGDEYGMYAGTRTMNASLVDRFSSFIEFTYMKADRESALLMALVPALTKDIADKMAQFAYEVRNAFSKGEVYNTVSPRGLTTLADCYATFTSYGTPNDKAFQLSMDMTILNKVTNDTRQKFIELASRTFGFKVA